MKSSLLLRISLCCLFIRTVYSFQENGNDIIKNQLSNSSSKSSKNPTKFIVDFKKCLFKEATEKLRQVFLKPGSRPTTTKNLKRQIHQNTLGMENSDINWDKCVLKSEFQQHNILEHEHMMAIKDEVGKLKQLIRLLQDQQYILNMMQNFEDKPKSKDIDEQEQLRQLLILLRGDSQQGKSFDEIENSISKELSHNFKEDVDSKSIKVPTIIEELEQLKKLITTLQVNQEEEKLKQEIEDQKRELDKLKEFIRNLPQPTTENPNLHQTEDSEQMQTIHKQLQNLEHKLSNLIPVNSVNSTPTNETNEISPNILGASLSKFKLINPITNYTHSESISRKAKTENEDNGMGNILNLINEEKSKMNQRTETNILQKKLKHLINPSNKKLSVSNPKLRAENEDLLDDFQKLLDNSELGSDLDVNFNENLENKLSSLQKQLVISSKLKKLEKKINQMQNADSKSLDDEDDNENIKNKIRKIEKQLKQLNNAQGKDLDDEEDIIQQLKTLQSDINKLKPKDDEAGFDISEGKDTATAIELALKKLLPGKKAIAKPLVGHKLHLGPAQIQLLKNKLIGIKKDSSSDHAHNFFGGGNLPYDSAYSPLVVHGGYSGPVYGPYSTSYGRYGNGIYGSYGPSNMLDAALNTQYGTSGSYQSGGVGYGSRNYASTDELYGLGSSSYGPNTAGYKSNRNQYRIINLPRTYRSQIPYGQGPASSPYQLKNPYDKVYGPNFPYSPGGELYGPYSSEFLHALNSGYYGRPSAGPYGLVPYATKNEKYPLPNMYSNTYGPEIAPYRPINIAYKSGSEPYFYDTPKIEKPTVDQYGTNKGQLKHQKYDLDNKQYPSRYDSNNEQYLNEHKDYDKQYGQPIKTDQYGTNSAYLNDAPKTYKSDLHQDKYSAKNINPAFSSEIYNHANPHPPESLNYVQPNIYTDGKIAGIQHRPQLSEPNVNVHNMFEHLAHGYQDPKLQFFPAYGNGYQTNSGNYQAAESINTQNQEQLNAYSSQNPAYTQEKVKDLTTQIYTLQDVINNLNRPEYTQKPEDKETVYRLDKKISDLKNVVSHLSDETPYSDSSSEAITKTGYRQSSFASPNDKDGFEEHQIDENFLHTQRKKRETNHIQKSKDEEIKSQHAVQNILQQLIDVVDIIKSFKRELFDEENLFQNTEIKNKNVRSEFIKHSQKPLLKNRNKRESPQFEDLENMKSESKKSDALSNFLHRLSDVMEVISYFSQNSPNAKNDSAENSFRDQNYTTQFDKVNNENNTFRQIRQTKIHKEPEENTNNTFARLLRHLVNLINKVGQLAQDVSKNSCACGNGKNCPNNKTENGILKNNEKTHKLEKRQLNENGEDDNDGDSNKGANLFLDKMSTFLKTVLDETNDHSGSDNSIEKQTVMQNQRHAGIHPYSQNNHYRLQQKLEELKKQLDSKLQTNVNHHQLPMSRHSIKSSLGNNLQVSSNTNPYSRSSYYPEPSYYPSYYMKPQHYSYPESSYESEDKKEKFKLKKESKKNDILDKIFSKILDKIIDKVTEAIPKITKRIFGLGIDKVLYYKDDYGYGKGGYGYDEKTYAIQQSFKNMGIFGYIPLIILKLVNNLTYFVKLLRKNKFIRKFLVPALITVGTAGMVIFLVWWLTGDDQYGYGNYGNSYGYSGNYDNSYGYSGNYGNSYRSNTGDNVDNDSYNRNNAYDGGNNYDKRQNGFERNSQVRNFQLTNANDFHRQRGSIDNTNNYYRYYYRNNNDDYS